MVNDYLADAHRGALGSLGITRQHQPPSINH